MKLVRLSLAAMVLCGLSQGVCAADTLEDAFKNGKVSGKLQAYYFDKEGAGNAVSSRNYKESILSLGVQLNYDTKDFYGFSLHTTFQSSNSPFATEAEKNIFYKDMYGPGSVLSQAYVQYNIDKTSAKIGRQFIKTFHVGGSDSRVIEESFEGITAKNANIPDTTVEVAYISKHQTRTTATTNPYGVDPEDARTGEFVKVVNAAHGRSKAAFVNGKYRQYDGLQTPFDDIYFIDISNKSIPHLTINAGYVHLDSPVANSDHDLMHIEGRYARPMGSYTLTADALLYGSQTGSALDAYGLEGRYLGFGLGVRDLYGFDAGLVYSTTSKDDSAILGYGNGIGHMTTSRIRGPLAGTERNTDAYGIKLGYNFSKMGINGVKTKLAYIVYDQPEQDVITGGGTGVKKYDAKYVSKVFEVYYNVPQVKGLHFGLEYEMQEETNANTEVNELRFKTEYKF